ncbi:OmpP1/FadL family transporter [sulfur-oxidizing endosymbiont of Gigantopelta aegis]|uniref:OmpP1/FadL family transporter n=1 Tax=sulfur-oxidizing endosymbiont of Gigantopelta aegis TaxID=2794934 RepID=UPI0018DE2D20|nr:outer membrane protein transport protein [sulfur-oxidizing endosymbiont of Gigantopelta aegis]
MNKSLKLAIAASTLISSLSLSSQVIASGFAIIENSASGMGQAFAGAAAVAEDPSTIFFNPAGMMFLEGTQMTAGMHIVDSNSEFKNKGNTFFTGTNEGGNAGDTFFIPNFYYVQDFAGKYKIGLGVNAPFGLGTDFGDKWIGRYASTESELKSINLNPSIAFRANDKLSIGLGMNIQYLEARLEKNINQFAFGSSDGSLSDGSVKVEGDSWAMGINGGFIYEFTPATRIGVHYRGEVSHDLEGDIKYKNLSPILTNFPVFANQDVTAGIDTPSTFSISMTHQLNDRLTLLGDVTHTKWSNFQELKIEGDNGSVPSLVEEKWSDSYRVALGMKYQYSPQWVLRTGVARDETPIANKRRTSRIPGDDRTWLSFGASYSPNSNLTIDVGYSHLWVKDAKINEEFTIAGIGTDYLKGEFEADVDILSAQATWRF